MKLLLDTSVFLWLMSDPKKLSSSTLQACQNESNTLILSAVSIWEIQIKHQRGKLELDVPLAEIIKNQIQLGTVTFLPITHNHILDIYSLPFFHQDPFDRLLIAQARIEVATLVTTDATILASYHSLVSTLN